MAPPAAKNFKQTQPITTGLRVICESYPANTCLRELLQNGDDAGATEIEYVLDTASYSSGPFLYDALQAYHGPALLVRNNSVFTDEDFKSLSSVGDSRKRHDAGATGKFGLGFNSVRPKMLLFQNFHNKDLIAEFPLPRSITGQTVLGSIRGTGC